MPMSLGNARTDLRERLDETNATFWDDSTLNNWLNDGVRDVARRCECLQQMAQIPAMATQRQYSMPSDTIRVHKVEFITGQNLAQTYPLEYRGIQEMDAIWGLNQQTLSSFPTYYTLWGNPPNLYMIVFPVPASSGDFNVWYYRLPVNAITDTQNLDIPEGWWTAPILYAEYIAKRKDADPTWQDAKDLYENEINYLLDRTQVYTDNAGVVSTGTANVPYWLYAGEWGM